MTCTQAYSGRRFCSAGQLIKKITCSWRPPTGTGLDTGPTTQEGGRWEAASFHSLPLPSRLTTLTRVTSLHSAPWVGEGVHLGAILAAKSPWHSLPLGEVEWLREFKPCILDTRALSSASLGIAGPCLFSCNMETSKQRLRWCPSGSLSAATPTGSPGSRACYKGSDVLSRSQQDLSAALPRL